MVHYDVQQWINKHYFIFQHLFPPINLLNNKRINILEKLNGGTCNFVDEYLQIFHSLINHNRWFIWWWHFKFYNNQLSLRLIFLKSSNLFLLYSYCLCQYDLPSYSHRRDALIFLTQLDFFIYPTFAQLSVIPFITLSPIIYLNI